MDLRQAAGLSEETALRPEAVDAYNSAQGLVVLAVGGAMCLVAYRVMIHIGRLPDEERVLR